MMLYIVDMISYVGFHSDGTTCLNNMCWLLLLLLLLLFQQSRPELCCIFFFLYSNNNNNNRPDQQGGFPPVVVPHALESLLFLLLPPSTVSCFSDQAIGWRDAGGSETYGILSSHISWQLVENWAPKWKETIILEIHPFSTEPWFDLILDDQNLNCFFLWGIHEGDTLVRFNRQWWQLNNMRLVYFSEGSEQSCHCFCIGVG